VSSADAAKPIVVVKHGGSSSVAGGGFCADVAELLAAGRHELVVVHGGGDDIERLARRLGIRQRRLVTANGVATRYTDAATLEVVTLALAGAAGPRLVGSLAARSVRAVGLTGLDGALLRARRVRTLRAEVDGRLVVVRDNHSGRITQVEAGLLRRLLAAGYVPVVSPLALAEDGRPVNVNADRAAAAVAAALRASALVVLTGAPGVLRDPADEASSLPTCAVCSLPPWAKDGMALKLDAAREALEAGIPHVVVADGRVERPLTAALRGAGTRVVLDGSPHDERKEAVAA
jgi:[amino group carrier protein]-L-2-aminoadipate 6-kinase